MPKKQQSEAKPFSLTPKFLKFEQPGETVVGEYLDSEYLPVGYETKDGSNLQLQHYLLTEEGVVVFNSTYQLHQAMRILRPGQKVRVTYTHQSRTRSYQVKEFSVQLLEPPQDMHQRILALFAGRSLQALPEPAPEPGQVVGQSNTEEVWDPEQEHGISGFDPRSGQVVG